MALTREQREIVAQIRREGRNIRNPRARRAYERAAVQTGLVESNLRNLPGGDADSEGWRQERRSLYPNPRNVRASVRRFRREFEQHYDPGEKSYEVAAQVQRPAAQYRGRYKQRARDAAKILRGADPPSGGRGSTETTRTTPGVDRSADRQAMLQAYLSQRGKPSALLELKRGLDSAQDTPSRTETTRRASRSTRSASRGDGRTNIDELAALAKRMGLNVGEHPKHGGVAPVHTRNSYHYRGAALDISGDPQKMARYARAVKHRYGRDLEELFYRGRGSGLNVKNGRRVGRNFVSGHEGHVHVADDDD